MSERGEDWPDWKDSGRRGSIIIGGCILVFGRVWADDFVFDGEEEIPIFSFHTEDGRELSFCDHDETFRFEPEP